MNEKPDERTLIRPMKGAGRAEIQRAIVKNQQLLMEFMNDINRQLFELRKDLTSKVREQFEQANAEVLSLINATLTETILQKEILIDKGLIIREEVKARYAEIASRKRKPQ
jgi:hypothetical protein